MIFRKLNVLSDDEMIKIVEAAFRVLERTGCRFEDPRCMEELVSIGCDVNKETLVVKFPDDIIFDAMNSVPSVMPPDDHPKLRLAGANKGSILDYDTKSMRPGVARDARNIIILCNTLNNITLSSAGVVPSDIPVDAVETYNTGLLIKYSEKLFTQWIYNPENVPFVLEMGRIATGGEEELKTSQYLNYMLNSVSPLRYPPRQLEIAREFAKLDLPIAIASMPQTCSSAPATLAGCLALCTAELLAGLVWIHSLHTKSAVALGALTAVSELRSGRQLYATPEQTLMYLGAHQIVRYLGYCSGNAGFESDSCDFDFQLGWEKALSGVLSWAAGFDMLGQAGFIMDGFSMEQLVLDNEALDMLARIGQGMIVNDDSLALEVIKKVGPGGHFLAERHTMAHARSFWVPRVFSRKNYAQWVAAGKKMVGDLAHEKVLDILEKNSLELQIRDDQAKAIDEVVKKRVEQLGGSLKGDSAL